MADKIVALDIGGSHLRAIEAEIKGGQPTIIRIASRPLESEIVENGKIVDVVALGQEIGKLWKAGKFKAKKVLVVAGGGSLQSRIVNNMPWAPDEDFKAMLPYTLRDKVPFELDDYYLDSHTLQEWRSQTDLLVYKKILMCAIHNSFADALAEALEINKLRLIGIDITPLTMIRAHNFSQGRKENQIHVLFDLGSDISTLVIEKNNQPIHQHISLNFGGATLTSKIAKILKITTEEANFLKVNISPDPEKIPTLTRNIALSNGKTKLVKYSDYTDQQKEYVKAIVNEEVSNILEYINDVLEDFFTSSSETMLHGFYLSGGGARLYNFSKLLSAEFNGIPCKIAEPFGTERNKKVPENVFENQNEYNNALGLLVGRNGY